MKTLIKKILKEQTSNTVLVVFGGIRYATAEFMLSTIPNRIKNKRIIIAKEYNSDISEVIDELEKIDYTRLEVTGFSAGGYNVFKLVKKVDAHFLGLIDPAVPPDWSLDGFPNGENSILFFNNDNWGGHPGIKERQEDLAAEMEDNGMDVVEEKNIAHAYFPSRFFRDHL